MNRTESCVLIIAHLQQREEEELRKAEEGGEKMSDDGASNKVNVRYKKIRNDDLKYDDKVRPPFFLLSRLLQAISLL